MRGRAWGVAVLAAVAGGCTVGPDYAPPRTEMAASYATELGGGVVAGPAELGRWWTRLGDPTLDSLVERAVAGNLTLREARARLVEARAQRRVVGADQYPTVDAAGSYTRSRGSENVLLGGSGFGAGGAGAPVVALPGTERDLYQAGFDAAWEIDVFGGTRRAVEAADADTQAAEAGLHDAMVTLLAEVARNYVEVRSLQERVRIAQENARAQAETAGLSRARSEAGLTSELDPVRAEAQLAATRAQIPALEAQLRQAEHRLAVLVGARPGSLGAELEAAAPVPPIPERVAVGIPSDLLRRRPDIRRAERELAAATARIGVATADLFPRFSLTGSFGLQSTKVASLADGDSRFWAIGPAVRWPVFSGGRIRGNIQVQGAQEEQALARYEGAVLTALEDVENALVNYSREQARRDSLTQGVESAKTALGLATELNARGLTDFLSVLDAQRQVYALEDQLAQSERAVTANVIALYKALGGGWEGEE